MKSFSEILLESTKTYEFRIKIAGILTDEQLDKLEFGLEKWGLQSMKAPKVTPIQKSPTDFVNLKEIEVTIIDIVLDYPATPQEITARIMEYTNTPENHIKVINCGEDCPVEEEQDEETEYEVQLTSEYPKTKEELPYGDKFVKGFLKDQKTKPAFKVAGGKTEKSQSTNDLEQGKSSPIGSKKV